MKASELLTFLIALAAVSAVAYLTATHVARAEVQRTTKVAVLDFSVATKEAVASGDASAIDRVSERAAAVASKLAADGYVVLDSQSILKAPKGAVYVVGTVPGGQ